MYIQHEADFLFSDCLERVVYYFVFTFQIPLVHEQILFHSEPSEVCSLPLLLRLLYSLTPTPAHIPNTSIAATATTAAAATT